MSDPASDGIHLTKDYYKDFLPTDLQWSITKVDDDFTLYDLFRLVHHANLMIPNISATMGMLQFEKFWNQIQLDRDPDDGDDVEYLELYWGPSYDIRVTPKTGKSTDQCAISFLTKKDENYWENHKICELPNLMAFHGVGQGCPVKDLDFHECGDDCPTETGYGIEFTPVNSLAHLPIRVSPKVEFFPPYVESDRELHRTGFELTIDPTLWCFITSVFWELTFVGSNPDEIADKSDDLSERIKDIKEQMNEDNDNDDSTTTY